MSGTVPLVLSKIEAEQTHIHQRYVCPVMKAAGYDDDLAVCDYPLVRKLLPEGVMCRSHHIMCVRDIPNIQEIISELEQLERRHVNGRFCDDHSYIRNRKDELVTQLKAIIDHYFE